MKFYLLLVYILSFYLFIVSCSTGNSENYEIKNSVITKTFEFSKTNPDAITVQTSSSLLNSDPLLVSKSPYFEFVINNQRINSTQKYWVFLQSSTREMRNKGTEHILVFEGKKEPVKGLQLVIYQQVFPESTLIREKLELKTLNGTFQLNKLEGKLHFQFPVYSIVNKNQKVLSKEIRIASFEKEPITFGNKKKGNHMYYPKIIESEITTNSTSAKGPVSILSNGEWSWVSAYEHASQDDLNGLLKKQDVVENGNLINDAMQGIKGVFQFPLKEEDFKFLGISAQRNKENVSVSVDVLRGAYLDGEIIDAAHPYSTVWSATGFYEGDNFENGKALIRNYLFNQICENRSSRVPEYYYNTWGLQRNDRTKPLRGILTYNRIFEEIEYAAELGVDIFVLDDGWQETQGIWYPNKERLNKGLAPIKERLDKHGMKLGLWYSPMGIDSTSQRYKEHQDWVVKDSEGNPIMAQWDHPAFDFVSDFFDVFIDDCKNMIDEGCRFMKWDAINTFYSSLPNLKHGSDKYSDEEIRARYEYLLPIYVVKAMGILTDYEPELVIEMDLTEARRVMTGLAPLSFGKLFWMNNGASSYNDYSTFRTQSMRTIANEFAGLIPLELFTYANYPQNLTGNMEYNIHNSMLAGHGFWGNLKLMNSEERKWVGEQVNLSKRVLPYIVDVNPTVVGVIGDSPEIYSVVNSQESAGQVISFSAEPVKFEINTEIVPEKMLAAINAKYTVKENLLNTPLNFKEAMESSAIVILPNNNLGISIQSSTVEIKNAEIANGALIYSTKDGGEQKILWNKKNGKPLIQAKNAKSEMSEKDEMFVISVISSDEGTISIKPEK